MEHAQSATDPLDLLTVPSDKQANAQLHYVWAILVQDGAMKKARNALAGHGSEIWRLLCEECGPRHRRRFQAMLSAILRVQLRDPLVSLTMVLRGKYMRMKTRVENPFTDEVLAATDITGIDSATVAQR